MQDGAERFGEALGRLEAELDWRKLGELHCHEGGAQFFPPEQVEAVRESGLILASALSERLRVGGRSLYVGAAVGELVVLLCDALVLGREVVAVNIENDEAHELNRALAVVEEACGFALPRIGFEELGALTGEFDHGWMVSVVNDPEAFPALHDELYGRDGELATGHGDLAQDRERASALIDAWLLRLSDGATLTTTDEELPLVVPRAASSGFEIVLDEGVILSAVVGDPVRFGRLQHRD